MSVRNLHLSLFCHRLQLPMSSASFRVGQAVATTYPVLLVVSCANKLMKDEMDEIAYADIDKLLFISAIFDSKHQNKSD